MVKALFLTWTHTCFVDSLPFAPDAPVALSGSQVCEHTPHFTVEVVERRPTFVESYYMSGLCTVFQAYVVEISNKVLPV